MAEHVERLSSADLVPVATFFDRPDELWDFHGSALYALARAVLGDEVQALRAVAVGMVDLYRAPAPEATLRSAASSVYQTCRASSGGRSGGPATAGQPLMAGLGELAWFQRSALALCVFGGHTYREAAAELGISADRAAWLLVSGLQELEIAAS